MKIHLKHQEIAPRCCSVFSLRKGHCAFCPWRSVEVKNDPQQYSDKELAADVDKRRAGLLALKHLPVVIEGEQEAANPADALASAGWEAAGTADGRDFIRCPFCLRTHIVQSFAYRIVNEEDNLCTATTCACFDNENSSNIYILVHSNLHRNTWMSYTTWFMQWSRTVVFRWRRGRASDIHPWRAYGRQRFEYQVIKLNEWRGLILTHFITTIALCFATHRRLELCWIKRENMYPEE